MVLSSTDGLITLKHGFVVHESVHAWLIEAWDRGLSVQITNGRLRVAPSEKVQAADHDFIRSHRDELVVMVACIERMCAEPV